MLHARPGPGLRDRALPVLLLSACTAAFAGLAVVTPGPQDPALQALTSAAPTELELADATHAERAQARASRSRRMDQQAAAAAAAKAKAAAQAQAAAKAKAEAAAKAKAEAAAKARRARSTPRSALRISGRCPVPNASFTDTWGEPRSGGRSHKGTDLMAPYGSPVYAVADGRVRTASSSAGGISLYLDADNGETYFYAHNSANVARSGQRVDAGQLVARVGTSGNAPSGAPHVHFERHVGGRSVNPYAFLRRIC